MASSTVIVLAPNGRRQTVKCTPNTTIMQIIEEVCKKHGYNSAEFDIKHHNKPLDTTTPFRFSGLPNNAQLELAPAAKIRTDREVILALNLDNGERRMGNFMPDATLWEVLTNSCPNEIGVNPVIIYTRREIWGDALHTTTLRSLGLTGGRAMLRLVHKKPEELKVQANVSAPIPAKPVEEKPYIRKKQEENEGTKSAPVQKMNDVDLLKLAKEKRKLTESPICNKAEVPKNKSNKFQENVEKMEVDPPPAEAGGATREPAISEDFLFLGERNAMVFSLESAQSVPTEDLPDDFFELTLDDAKKILKDIRQRRFDMEEALLMTSAQRNLEESKKQLRQLNRYKKAIIRIQFPDRTVLQGNFNPSETIADVKSFVTNYLKTNQEFYLYTTPPKNILPDEKSLIEIGCVPGALLHLGTKSDSVVSLKDELRDLYTTTSVASRAASKFRREYTREVGEEQNIPPPVIIYDPGPSTSTYTHDQDHPPRTSPPTGKVPKWFKRPMK